MRILVVDDEPAVRRAVERALHLEGYEVGLAADGADALQQLATTP
ncbi:MAG: response regulator, partial [Actinobacteria bacterium]|nr:response regulator [Actinomycetota bacterium]